MNVYMATYRVDGSCTIHWALVLAPRNECPYLPNPASMTYRVVRAAGRRCYQQCPTLALPEMDILGKMLVGRVDRSQLRALEQLLADPRHYAAQDGSSRSWTRAVLTVLAEGHILKSEVGLDVAQAIRVMATFSDEIWRGRRTAVDELDAIPTIKYPGV
ncbi:hypothetical protein B0H21DRAFT_695178 [Amylocystis lapponica]|nr:hypothetical protein B0H21DRAFT_695178 [Amylocystis lapponica]